MKKTVVYGKVDAAFSSVIGLHYRGEPARCVFSGKDDFRGYSSQ